MSIATGFVRAGLLTMAVVMLLTQAASAYTVSLAE
jgi:hypothetical protein